MDKVFHFAAYALLGALFLRAFKTTRIKHNLKLIIMLSVLFSALYGISDEIHQSFVPYRTADAMDAVADILGSAFGVYLFFKINTGKNAKITKNAQNYKKRQNYKKLKKWLNDPIGALWKMFFF